MAKAKPLKLPNPDSISLLFEQARKAPLNNMDHAAKVNAALDEVGIFLAGLFQPQTSSGLPADAGAGSKPQASANAGGN